MCKSLKYAALTPAFLASLVSVAWAQSGSEEDTGDPAVEIVVLGSFAERTAQEIGSALTIIDEEALAARQTVLISDVLRETPGLAVNRTGPQGTLTQVRIRGAEANQTLVYIDGVEANNPIFGEFNFANLLAADVARVEVIRGPQSALYGSEAIGGVIAIETRDPGEGLSLGMEAEAGSFGTLRGFAALGYGTDAAGVRGAVQYYDTDGVSSSPSGAEEDGFENLTASLKGVFAPLPSVSVEAVVRYVDSTVETDAQEFAFGTVQDADQTTEAEDFYAKIDLTGELFGGLVTPRAYVAYTESENVNLVGGLETSASTGERLDYGVQLRGGLSQGRVDHGFTFAVEREDLDFDNGLQARSDEQTSLVGEYTFDFDDRLFLSAAVRQDFNEVFDDAVTYRVAGAYLIPSTGTRFHASWGEGITDPTFFERFGFNPDSFIGNPDLKPERSQGFDIGVEQSFADGAVVLDVTYFDANLEDEITTVFDFVTFVSSPVNLTSESERSGVEATLAADLGHGLSFTGQYTYLDAIGGDGLIEVRRPEHTASANLTLVALNDRATFNLGVIYNGESEDSYFGFADPNFTPRRTLDAYTLINLAARYALTDRMEVFARAENITDEEYQEVLGFAAPGAAGFIGVRLAQ